jgi:hypothetical protein
MISSNCDVNAPNQPTNEGCSIQALSTNTYGSGFNTVQGGVYAVQWNSTAISIWFFARGSIPSNVQSADPDPSMWGQPLSQFTGACNVDNFVHPQHIVGFFSLLFKSNQILSYAHLMFTELILIKSHETQIFNTAFCGPWADSVWSSDSTCASKASNCENYVKNNPSAFMNAYWTINSVKVYQ